jgi:hypothetical protein
MRKYIERAIHSISPGDVTEVTDSDEQSLDIDECVACGGEVVEEGEFGRFTIDTPEGSQDIVLVLCAGCVRSYITLIKHHDRFIDRNHNS